MRNEYSSFECLCLVYQLLRSYQPPSRSDQNIRIRFHVKSSDGGSIQFALIPDGINSDNVYIDLNNLYKEMFSYGLILW